MKLGKNAVKTKNIAANAVTSPKVKNGSLLARAFKRGQFPSGLGSKGDPGPGGNTGTAGPTGSPGPTASAAVSDNPTDFDIDGSGQISDGGSFTSMSQAHTVRQNAPGIVNAPLTGSAVKPPGTYTVRAHCQQNVSGATEGPKYDLGDMTVVAAAS